MTIDEELALERWSELYMKHGVQQAYRVKALIDELRNRRRQVERLSERIQQQSELLSGRAEKQTA